MHRDYEKQLRNYHQAKWNEELIFDLSVPGERGVLVTPADASVIQEVGSGLDTIPASLKRKKVPNLPEVNQVRANRHFMRLSQETLSVDTTPDFEGTCTMKYSPKVQEHMVARNPKFTEVHPLQPDETKQGLLEIYYETEQMLKAISGMDAFSLQPGGGATAVFAAACVIRAYHESRGEGYRDEIVTTIFSHPCDAAGPATAGYKVITLMIDPEKGYPSLEDMKAALSERTAAIFITNPEDTGIYNPDIKEYVEAAHEVGAICYYDQANANGMLGIARAKEVGFDAIHYNLHKTFSAPHGGLGSGLWSIRCDQRSRAVSSESTDFERRRKVRPAGEQSTEHRTHTSVLRKLCRSAAGIHVDSHSWCRRCQRGCDLFGSEQSVPDEEDGADSWRRYLVCEG